MDIGLTFVVAICGGALGGYCLDAFIKRTPSILLKEIFVGCFLPVVCFIPGFYAVSWAVDRPFRPFIIAVFGGMLIRLVFIGIAFILIVTLTKLRVSSLLFSLVGFYTLCLVVELCFVKAKYN